MFYVYETKDLVLKFTPTGVLDNYKEIVVSIYQDNVGQIDKTTEDLVIDTEEDTITVSLSQEDTGQFEGGSMNNPRQAIIQTNIYYNSTEERDVSKMATLQVLDNLYKEKIDG